MDRQAEARDFLVSRRASISPDDAGLPQGTRRRVPGLRRHEVADLAGLSVDYYARLERGNLKGATDEVLDAIATALRLGDDERSHLHDLARGLRRQDPRRDQDTDARSVLRPGLCNLLTSVTAATLVVDFRTNVIAANRLAQALYADMFTRSDESVNYAKFVFLAPSARVFYHDWEAAADEVAATLHRAVGRYPGDQPLTRLVDQLAADGAGFKPRWDSQAVRRRSFGVKQILHRSAGALELSYETLELPSEPDLSVMIYSPEANSPTARALRALVDATANEVASTSR